MDELDNYKATEEGDPEDLAGRTAITFRDGLDLKSSTPTLAGLSRIWTHFAGDPDAGIPGSDQQYYHVPCCHCGEMQPIDWEQFKFTFSPEEYQKALAMFPVKHDWPLATAAPGKEQVRDPRRTVFVCRKCSGWWTDEQRIAAILSGLPDKPAIFPTSTPDGAPASGTAGLRAHWVSTAPFNGIIGRHLSGHYAYFGKKRGFVNHHHMFAERFLTAYAGGREKLMAWTNMVRCLPFRDKFDQVKWNPIMKRAEEYDVYLRDGRAEIAVPVEAVLLTAGADVHPDRVEILVKAWGEAEESWMLEKIVVWGNFDLPEMQERVDAQLLRKWHHPVLGDLSISAAGIDLGHQTKLKSVYRFCKQRFSRRVYAVKGSPVPNAPVYTANFDKRYGVWRYNLGTDTIKNTLFDRLAIGLEEEKTAGSKSEAGGRHASGFEGGPRTIHFPKPRIKYRGTDGKETELITEFNEKFYKQLCAEKRMRVKGQFKTKWVQTEDRNEALDCEVYNIGAFEILNPLGTIAKLWQQVQKAIEQNATIVQPKQDTRDYILKQPGTPASGPASTNKPPNKKRRTMGGGWSGKKWL